MWHYQIFINKDYINIKKYSNIKFFNYFFLTNQSGTNFNVSKKTSTALSHVSWVFYLTRQYFSTQELMKLALSHISRVSHWSGKEPDIKRQVSTALSRIFWFS